MKTLCLLVDNGTDGFEMGGFFENRESLPEGWEDENHQLWEIETGELLEEKWN